jgi:putative membrane protein
LDDPKEATNMKSAFSQSAIAIAAAATLLGGCTTDPRVSVNTAPAVVAPAPAVAVITPTAPSTVVMGAGTFTATDRDFAHTAALANMMEIGSSQMAPKHTSSPDVLRLADTINRDHTMAMNDLMGIMQARGMAIPGDIAPHQRNVMDKLGTDFGYEYDRDFVGLVGVRSHEADIAYMQQQMGALSDPALRDWAARTLPHMQMHLRMAQDIYGRIAG